MGAACYVCESAFSLFCSSLQMIQSIDYHTRYISNISVGKFLCKWNSEIELAKYKLWIHCLRNDHLKHQEALSSTLKIIILNFMHYPIILSYICTIIIWELALIPSSGAEDVKMLSLGTTWRRIVGVEAQSHSFLISSLTLRPLYHREKNPSTHSAGDWGGLSAVVDFL